MPKPAAGQIARFGIAACGGGQLFGCIGAGFILRFTGGGILGSILGHVHDEWNPAIVEDVRLPSSPQAGRPP
ncbi:MAG: hypothetical protein L0Z63_02990 [Actinobacteria bacterium]|nr:hypothetical protein [Actinomycetota bacterium]